MTSILRSVGILVGLLLIAASSANAAPATAPSKPGEHAGKDDAMMAAQLDLALPPIKFDAVGFSDVIDFLRDVNGANIFVNWKALEAAGIDKNAPVTVNLHQVKFGKCLRVILDSVGGERGRLAMAIDSGVITISTAGDLGKDALPPVRGSRYRRGHAEKVPDTQVATRIPDAMIKLKGKTVKILFKLVPPKNESAASYTYFVTELLEQAGSRVVRLYDLQFKVNPGDVLVLGEIPAEVHSDGPTPNDGGRFEKSETLRQNYRERKKQLIAEAASAGAQVVEAGQVDVFFGLNSATQAAWARYEVKSDHDGLDLMILPMKLDSVGLSDVVDFLRDVNAMNIFVNWKALEAVGIDKQAPVTINLRGVTFAKTVQVILDSVGGAKGMLAYDIDSHVMTISTASDLFGEPFDTVARAYDVRFLVPENLDADARDKRIAALLKLAVENIDPPSWGMHDGKSCTLMELKGELTVIQTEKNQKSIENVIKQLRDMASTDKP